MSKIDEEKCQKEATLIKMPIDGKPHQKHIFEEKIIIGVEK